MAPRKAISKKVRFEIFKRDSFKCQYCGMSAPDVILNVDHIKPVADGGTNHATNLITSCFDCNSGKSDRLLDDNTMLEKQKKQLEELNERRMQLEMMMEWREGLSSLEDDKVNYVAKKWAEVTNNHSSLTATGVKTVKGLLKKYGLNDVLDAIETSSNQYLVMSKGKYTDDSLENVWKKVKNILAFNKSTESKPYLKDLYYMRGILKNRLHYMNPHKAIAMLEEAYLLGASKDSLSGFVKSVRNWTDFQEGINNFIESQEKGDEEDGAQEIH